MSKLEISVGKTILIVLLALTATSIIATTYASTPAEPHAADSMWVEPSSVDFTPANGTVGNKFNVTVWLNIASTDVFGYQVAMLYNRTQLKCTRAGYTDDFMDAPPSGLVKGAITIDGGLLGNGSVLGFETCYAPENITVPKVGSVMWIEFQIMMVPSNGALTSTFDVSSKYPSRTWVKDPVPANIPITTYDGTYTVIPEFSYLSILLLLMFLTLVTIAFRKRMPNSPKCK